ncbi:glycosyltransferase [Cellulosilyticum ruminicola]|uniref:glycosyltransferase n=1 Tax=Cellulosilyticum ruminicola TaxID=425254 RepID=UPI0006D17428|nr:glycosyltransferase [Cellulosilyticum ruminicola]
MCKKIVVWILFNTINYTPARLTKEWIDERIGIFEKYTLKSMKAQTNQNFEVYLCCDKTTMPIINECLAKRLPLPPNIHFDTTYSNSKAVMKDINNYDYLYHIRLDSDNLYHKDFIQKLYDYKPKKDTQVIITQNGYMYDGTDDRLATYYQPSPPFYTFIYKVQDYIDGFRYNTPGGHGNVIKMWKYELIEGLNYLVTIHGKNVSNFRGLVNKKALIEGENKERILKEFGMQDRLSN